MGRLSLAITDMLSWQAYQETLRGKPVLLAAHCRKCGGASYEPNMLPETLHFFCTSAKRHCLTDDKRALLYTALWLRTGCHSTIVSPMINVHFFTLQQRRPLHKIAAAGCECFGRSCDRDARGC